MERRVMSGRFGGLLDRAFVASVLLLGVIGLSIFALFNFVAISQLSIEMGFVLFVLAALLLIVGYMVGIIVLGLLAIFVLTRFWERSKMKQTDAAK